MRPLQVARRHAFHPCPNCPKWPPRPTRLTRGVRTATVNWSSFTRYNPSPNVCASVVAAILPLHSLHAREEKSFVLHSHRHGDPHHRFPSCFVWDSSESFFSKMVRLNVPVHLVHNYPLHTPRVNSSFATYSTMARYTLDADSTRKNRSPDIVNEHVAFRRNLINHLDSSAFNKPLCEVLLDQRYFNGVGNYLRAEIMYRARVDPFACARTVLCVDRASFFSSTPKYTTLDAFITVCKCVVTEAVAIRRNERGAMQDVVDTEFSAWLACFRKDDASSTRDSNGRLVWFYPLATSLSSSSPLPPSLPLLPASIQSSTAPSGPMVVGEMGFVYPPRTRAHHVHIQRILVARDPRLERVFSKVGFLNFQSFQKSPMNSIVSVIIGQQISYVKAKGIRKQLYTLLPNAYTANDVLGVPDDAWTMWGLAPKRVAAIRTVVALPASTWTDPIQWTLVANVGGIGPWSIVAAKLMCMEDPDLWPEKDVFLERRVRRVVGSGNGTTLPVEWTGFRSYIAWYLWRYF